MLLFRFLRLWYCLLFQTTTLSPRCMYIYTEYVYLNIHHGRLVSQCFGTYEFTRFQEAKTKRVRRFLSICQRNALRLGSIEIDRCKTILRCKITNNFSYMQEICCITYKKLIFFS